MSNTFGISPKPYFDECKAILEDNQQNIQDMHSFHLPEICTLATAIKAKTDATPQNVRAFFESIGLNTESSSFVPLLDIPGAGILYKLGFALVNSADTIEVKVTIDSYVAQILSHTGDLLNRIVIPTISDPGNSTLYLIHFDETGNENNFFNIEFNDNLKIEFRRSAGTGGYVYCKALYGYDSY